MDDLHRSTMGQIGESLVLAKLLETGLEVFESVVDIRGVDFLARVPGYSVIEIQVKTVGTERDPEWFLLEIKDEIESFRDRPYFVVGVTQAREFWIFPPEVFFDSSFANISTSDRGITTVDLNLATKKRGETQTNRERLRHLKDNWEKLLDRSRKGS